jgi:hypothetical protein
LGGQLHFFGVRGATGGALFRAGQRSRGNAVVHVLVLVCGICTAVVMCRRRGRGWNMVVTFVAGTSTRPVVVMHRRREMGPNTNFAVVALVASTRGAGVLSGFGSPPAAPRKNDGGTGVTALVGRSKPPRHFIVLPLIIVIVIVAEDILRILGG